MTHPVSRYVPLLIEGDLEGLRDLFGNAPRINDPRLGWVEGTAFELFVAASSEGLAERQARVEASDHDEYGPGGGRGMRPDPRAHWNTT